MTTRIPYSSTRPGGMGGLLRSGPLGRALAIVAGGMVLVAGLFVSAVVFSVLLVVGVVAGGWFWWKTRDLRKPRASDWLMVVAAGLAFVLALCLPLLVLLAALSWLWSRLAAP